MLKLIIVCLFRMKSCGVYKLKEESFRTQRGLYGQSFKLHINIIFTVMVNTSIRYQ